VPLQTRPELLADRGVVASTHFLATAAGMAVLETGGLAADAAVATGFALQVVEPHLNGPGGDVPLLVRPAGADRPVVVCGQGVSPAAATIDHYRGLGLGVVPGTGQLAAVVPGAMGAWLLVLERWGRLRLREVLEPALSMAERGWPVQPRVAGTLQAIEGHLREHWPTSAATWLLPDRAPRAGERWRWPELADMWRALLAAAVGDGGRTREQEIEAARAYFYEGPVAQAIADFSATPVMDTSGVAHTGLLTLDDLARWRATVEEPVTLTWQGWEIAKTGPWGQGPVLLQQLALLQGLDLADTLGAEAVHLVTEVAKLAFADREAWYADPVDTDVPVQTLLSSRYNDERRRLLTDAASGELRPGAPDGRQPVLPRYDTGLTVRAPGSGEPTRGDTCHLDVADRAGTIISATPSGGWLQSNPTVPGAGFCLGSRAQMFWLDPRVPGRLRPGVRPRTTLTPSLARHEDGRWLAWGTPGGDQQDQWSLLFLLRHTVGGLGLQTAIDAPAHHSEHMPSSFWPRTAKPRRLVVEDRIGPVAVQELSARGHDVEVVDGWSLGRLSAVGIDAGPDGWLRAAANPRGAHGYAAGR